MRKLLAILVVVIAGCAGTPDVADRNPYFTAESDLLKKAQAWEDRSIACVTSQGPLLYKAWAPDPWNQIPGTPGYTNYVDSHDIADAPAWHGHFMASLAFAQAVDGKDRSAELKHLAEGLERYYEVTGITGLWGRSYLYDYVGPRLPWMETEKERPTKFWGIGPTGKWWRTGLAKNHFNAGVFGFTVPLVLDRAGHINLTASCRAKLIEVLMPAARRFAENDFKLVGYDGETTQFGNLGPQVVNGFNMIIALNVLRTAAYYDASLLEIYNEKIDAWISMIDFSTFITSFFTKAIGHWNFDKPSFSDIQAFGLAATALLMQEEREKYREDLRDSLSNIWSFMKYERNPTFTVPYLFYVGSKTENTSEYDGNNACIKTTQDMQNNLQPQQKANLPC